ncbi:MAG: ABC transporter permease [Vampirovibrionia bacterium]
MKAVFYLLLCRFKARKFLNLLSFVVIAFCVAVLIVALSLSNGFEKSLVDKIILAAPHVTVSGDMNNIIIPDRLEISSIEDVAQVQSLLINSDTDDVQGGLLRGTSDNDFLCSFSKNNILVEGKFPSEKQLIIGNKLAQAIGISVGDSVNVLTGPAIVEEFEVSGIFKAGLYDYDSTVALAMYDDVLSFTPEEGEGIAARVVKFKSIRLKDPLNAKKYADNIALLNPNLFITNWQDDNKSLFSAIALEKKVIFIVLILLIVAVSIAIANSQFIQIIAQREQIAICTAMGFKSKQILITYLLEALMLGIIGSLIGIFISLVVIYYLSTYPMVLPIDIYQVESIPIEFNLFDMFKTVLSTVFLVCISSVIPAFYAAKLDPVEVLRTT